MITRLSSSKFAVLVAAVTLIFALAWSVMPVWAAVPSAPVITTPTQSTSTNPIILTGTADTNTTITITGGASASNATTTSGGNWSASVNLSPNSANTLAVVATNVASSTEVSATSTVTVTHYTATSSPIITLSGQATTTVFACNGFTDPGVSAVDSAGGSINATSSGSVNINEPGTYTITYTATDASGNTSTATRTVVALPCSSGSVGGGGGGGSSRVPQGLVNAAINANVNSNVGAVLAGQVLGRLNMPGLQLGSFINVLGVSTAFTFVSDLSVGARGPEVAELQRRLAETGYFRGPITGYFGPITRDALMRLQRANGLTATGMLDAQTRLLLNS